MNVIANRYAEALFQIGEEEKLTDMLYQELSEIVNLIKVNQDLFSILKSYFILFN
ncbi:MAG: F0F1 ATP synthase subunit delta, partial [Peptostreptococcaceae bacterium]|nr:F0F1 ATP synthase subunit delta [Peptostreptococcaceae bacterium]